MSGVDAFDDEVNAACRGWIPAFAGMTVVQMVSETVVQRESGYPGSGEALVPSTLNSYTPSGLLPRDWGTDYNTTVGPGVRGPSG